VIFGLGLSALPPRVPQRFTEPTPQSGAVARDTAVGRPGDQLREFNANRAAGNLIGPRRRRVDTFGI
jgi:hypothetical protein